MLQVCCKRNDVLQGGATCCKAVLHAANLQCCNPVLQNGANFTEVNSMEFLIENVS
jgi:hypothetical protein